MTAPSAMSQRLRLRGPAVRSVIVNVLEKRSGPEVRDRFINQVGKAA